jgi:hypothetical protein
LVAARTAEEADALVDLVESIFEIKRLRGPVGSLCIDIQRDRRASIITLTQMV